MTGPSTPTGRGRPGARRRVPLVDLLLVSLLVGACGGTGGEDAATGGDDGGQSSPEALVTTAYRLAADGRFERLCDLVLPDARHEILSERDAIRDDFWAAFDAFVPGTVVSERAEHADTGRAVAAAMTP